MERFLTVRTVLLGTGVSLAGPLPAPHCPAPRRATTASDLVALNYPFFGAAARLFPTRPTSPSIDAATIASGTMIRHHTAYVTNLNAALKDYPQVAATAVASDSWRRLRANVAGTDPHPWCATTMPAAMPTIRCFWAGTLGGPRAVRAPEGDVGAGRFESRFRFVCKTAGRSSITLRAGVCGLRLGPLVLVDRR